MAVVLYILFFLYKPIHLYKILKLFLLVNDMLIKYGYYIFRFPWQPQTAEGVQELQNQTRNILLTSKGRSTGQEMQIQRVKVQLRKGLEKLNTPRNHHRSKQTVVNDVLKFAYETKNQNSLLDFSIYSMPCLYHIL